MVNIAFDLDNTLVECNVIKEVLLQNNLNPNKYDFSSGLTKSGISKKIKDIIINRFSSEKMGMLKPIPYAKHVLEELTRFCNVNIYIITSRPITQRKITNKLIAKHFGCVDLNNVYYVGHFDKSYIIKKLNISIMIDDSVRYIKKLNLNKTFMFIIQSSFAKTAYCIEQKFRTSNNICIVNNIKNILF